MRALCLALTLLLCSTAHAEGDAVSEELEALATSFEVLTRANNAYQDGRLDEAKFLAERSAKLAPKNHMAWLLVGLVEMQKRDWMRAQSAFARAALMRPTVSIYHLYMGICAFQSRDYKGAQPALEKAIELDPRLYRADYFLGRIHEQAGRSTAAAAAYTKAAMQKPSDGHAFAALASLYLRWDRVDLVLAVVAAAKHVQTPALRSELEYTAGLAHGEKNNHAMAVVAHTAAIKASSSNLLAVLHRGFALAELGKKTEAIADLQAFVRAGGEGDAFLIQAANSKLMQLTSSPARGRRR